MIQKDYIVRMIEKIISLLVEALLQKRKLENNEIDEYKDVTKQILGMTPSDLVNYSPESIIDKYSCLPESAGRIELAALIMIMISNELDEGNILQKARLEQNGVGLLKYLQQNSGTFSFQREEIINKIIK